MTPTGDTVRVLQVIETDLVRRGDGSKDNPFRRVTQYWSVAGELLAERDDAEPTHCNAIGHRFMKGDNEFAELRSRVEGVDDDGFA